MAARSSLPDPSPKLRIERLRKRADFLAAARHLRRVAGAITLEMAPTPDKARSPESLRLGFTASKKIGNAVARNRAKRRLRAAAYALLPLSGREGHDYVLIARQGILVRDFAALKDDIAEAARAAHQKLDAATRPTA
ncbi:MAG TPA: ribonuclease P protein component [Rhizomicrobium sp.]|jgi:ribonuclease P protein component|nr:ribonuclease P protein component [Rhizomicrobium sp.]